jgi:carboxymethylenebutenolidase
MTSDRDIVLTSPFDGFSFGAVRIAPDDARRGGLVLIHDVFGVTQAIRDLCDGFAADGYEVIAPSLFDRLQRGFQADDGPSGGAAGRRLSEAAPWDQVADDLQAAIDALAEPVNMVGYGWGGTAAWLAACRCGGVAAASSYYGQGIPELLAQTPRYPIILHIGKRDPSIPPEAVETIAAAYPDIPTYLYDAGGGFASDRPADHDPDSARLAHLRTLQLFQRSSGVRAEQ